MRNGKPIPAKYPWKYHFEPPHTGGHLRVVQTTKPPPDYDQSKDPSYVPLHETRVRDDGVLVRGGQSYFTSPMHKSETVDYGICLSGERVLVLDTQTLVMKPGDVVVQLGNWHLWSSERSDVAMAFVIVTSVAGAAVIASTDPPQPPREP